MQDELQIQPEPGQEPSAEETSNTDSLTPSGSNVTEPASPSPARVPAATASSYRDIIAERLARKSGDQTTSAPLAHSSDVERAAKHTAPVEPSAATGEIAPEIEIGTKRQEISAEESPATDSSSDNRSNELGSRERARLRQQERAALRRGGPRQIQAESEEPMQGEEPSSESSEPQRPQREDVIAERMTRQQPGRPQRPERPREERRSDRPERERTPRTAQEQPALVIPAASRTERPVKEERAAEPRRAEPILARRSEVPAERAPRGEERITRSEDRTARSEERVPRPDERVTPASAQNLATKLGISVVVPLYNEQDSLRELTALVKQQCSRLAGPKYEIIYINDGSTDRSGEILEDILATSSRVTALTFRRNLGKSSALAAGFAEAQYGIVITMDADLQDDPREFVNLIGKLAEGYDLVSGWKKKRHDPMSKTGPSKFFNWVTSFFSGIRLHDFNCGLKAYRKEVTDSLQVYGELHRYLPALAYWQGFRVTEIVVTHHPRKFGKSKFGSSRFFKGFLDLMSIVFTNRYGKRPLHLFGTIGTLMAIAGFVIDIWLTVQWALGQTSLSNRPLLLLGLLLILVGAQLISIGLLGEMIVKNAATRSPGISYQTQKGRPSAEARERRASRAARITRTGAGRPGMRPERRGQPRSR